MNDKVSLWQAVKDNWGQLTVIGGALLIFAGVVMEWRVRSNVAAALAAEDLATDSKIIEMDKVAAANTAGVTANKDNIEDNERRVEQAFAVLLGRDPDDQ
jgi:hypothetical protein